MKAIVDKDGLLKIERAGKMRDQHCVFDASTPVGFRVTECGDWCPAFREPMQYRDLDAPLSHRIKLCQQVGTLYFDEIEDQRGK